MGGEVICQGELGGLLCLRANGEPLMSEAVPAQMGVRVRACHYFSITYWITRTGRGSLRGF